MGDTAAKMKGKIGCGGGLGLMLITFFGLTLVLYPWALHMGGRFTPALTWHGYGRMHSSTGANYGLYLNLGFDMPRGRGGMGRPDNLRGSAMLCTQQGALYKFEVSGREDAWFDTDGKKLDLFLRTPKDAGEKLRFDLFGGWKGTELVLEDKGNLAISFNADGTAKGFAIGPNAPKEETRVTLQYGKQEAFDELCGSQIEKRR